ncbi:DinB family protein [Spirosoma arcticum]
MPISTPSEIPEVWLRGPLPDVPPLLQPVAHALMQAREEVTALMGGFPDERLWERPHRRTAANRSGQSANAVTVASVGFHLQHLTGVLDRLFTYARGEALSANQLTALAQEGKDNAESPVTVAGLVRRFDAQVDTALAQLRRTDERTLTDVRMVGRAQVPSTVMGLLVHSAEHTTRHVGQLLVTARWVGEYGMDNAE